MELGWGEGRFTTLDANSDWTLAVSADRWADPFVSATHEERERLLAEVGLWEQAEPPGEMRGLIGRTVSAVEPLLSEVGELVGVEIVFGDVVLVARTWAGDLVVRATHA